jgi:hypothetical protein
MHRQALAPAAAAWQRRRPLELQDCPHHLIQPLQPRHCQRVALQCATQWQTTIAAKRLNVECKASRVTGRQGQILNVVRDRTHIWLADKWHPCTLVTPTLLQARVRFGCLYTAQLLRRCSVLSHNDASIQAHERRRQYTRNYLVVTRDGPNCTHLSSPGWSARFRSHRHRPREATTICMAFPKLLCVCICVC